MSRTDDFHKGLILGFDHARDNPDQSRDEFVSDLESLREQLEALPSWKLRLIAGKGTVMDQLRFRMSKKNPGEPGQLIQ